MKLIKIVSFLPLIFLLSECAKENDFRSSIIGSYRCTHNDDVYTGSSIYKRTYIDTMNVKIAGDSEIEIGGNLFSINKDMTISSTALRTSGYFKDNTFHCYTKVAWGARETDGIKIK